VAQKNTFKRKKFEDRIMNEINSIFRTKLSDKRLQFVSVTKVEMSVDYSQAVAYWDTYDASVRGDVKKAIDNVKSKIRVLLSSSLNVRHVPSIEFKYDSQFEAEQEIDKILDEEAKLGKGY
jgi:ribosome-binding factor A